ncbi:MAG TPA: sugar ABC transporter substrate-binding protein [Candidatus Limnocylindrales bacterium]|nr:sugar ABC transporter substrate-binding protein [Candidatus Limnocylindrales bacterium]
MDTRKRYLTLLMAALFVISACTAQTPASQAPASQAPAPSTGASTAPSEPAASAAPSPLAVDPAEAVIPNIEANAEIGLWTFWLSPTLDDYIKNTIARFQETYPGVKVNWEDHQATFQDDLKNSFAAGNAPDVINLSVGEGWVSDYATRGLLLDLDSTVPQDVKDIYFDGLWKSQNVDGKNYQFPWYQGVSVELINKRLYEAAGLKVEDFPKTVQEVPAVCKTIYEKTKVVCDLRLTVNDLLAQMVYEGGVKVISDDGKTFTFDSADAVAWLQMYVDMVKGGHVDNTALTTPDDRVGLLIFSAGQAPFYQTGPNLIREVKSNNASLYEDLAVVPAPVGKSGVLGKGLMGMSVKADTKFPNASIALAQYFTNPRAMVEFAKQVAVYPSSAKAFEDPFFSSTPELIEDSARPIAGETIAKYADIVPTIPKKADVNAIVLAAIEKALFGDVPAQQALTDAVAAANKLLQ